MGARDRARDGQLVYFHFDNRAGLLTAMARHRDESSGFIDAVAAARNLPPVEGFEHLLRAWCEYMPEIAWSRIQPTTFQHLVAERGWTPDEYTERTVRSLLAELATLAG